MNQPLTIRDSVPPGARIAAVDVGSNSVRLVVAEVLPSGAYRILDEERENTRLASSLASTGRLDANAVGATLVVLSHFLSIANGFGAMIVRAIGTSALREASDGAEFCQHVREQLNLDIEVISAEKEARLAFLSVARAFDISQREVAVTDIGGGSTEIILASSGVVDRIYSTHLGSVRVTEECATADRSSENCIKRLRRYIDQVLEHDLRNPPFVPDLLIGTGGTFTALASMIMARKDQNGQPISGLRISRAQIRHLVSDLASLTLDKRRKIRGLNPDRADIIVAGLTVIERIVRRLHVNVVQIHTRGVRDGLLLTMIQES